VHLKPETREFSIELQPSIRKLSACLFGNVLDWQKVKFYLTGATAIIAEETGSDRVE
jgi:hypothetical protein